MAARRGLPLSQRIHQGQGNHRRTEDGQALTRGRPSPHGQAPSSLAKGRSGSPKKDPIPIVRHGSIKNRDLKGKDSGQ